MAVAFLVTLCRPDTPGSGQAGSGQLSPHVRATCWVTGSGRPLIHTLSWHGVAWRGRGLGRPDDGHVDAIMREQRRAAHSGHRRIAVYLVDDQTTNTDTFDNESYTTTNGKEFFMAVMRSGEEICQSV
uniref:OO_Ba0013J05-OO_Ba0033A15.37 protein n=1 Tax=Oryza officinalis TaxID=4535 RepID=D0ABI0_9ORYZ|nr:OO_Ba0013J05-OO_Ba0033A15.37 [Oryza officinalis]